MITTTQYDRRGDFHKDMAWVSLNDVFVGTFDLVSGVGWSFRPGLISGMAPDQLRMVADALDKFGKS